jgi:uncharacterized RDD family membrane protein YckC
MEIISISTTQNIDLEHSLASVGERIVAHIIDYCLFLGYYLIVLLIFSVNLFRPVVEYIYILAALPILFYDLVCELAFNGQNAGKRAMKLKVVMADGSQPSFLAYFIRWIFRIVDNVLLFGGISTTVIIINGRSQRIGDLAAGTTVVRLKKKQNLESLMFPALPPNYQPAFPESINLTEKEYKIIKEVLEFRYKTGLTDPAYNLMVQTKTKLEQKLAISTDMNNQEFLKALINDYIYYNREK